MKRFYIFMGDIVGSRKKNGKIVMRDFKEIVNRVNNEHRDLFLSPMTITLGDEFQSILVSLKSAIEVIFAIEETIVKFGMSLKLRYALNFGPIDTKINSEIAYGMLGEGLTEARKILEKKKGPRFFIRTGDDVLSEKMELSFFLYQSIVDDWRLKDYQIIKEFWVHDDYKKVAKYFRKDVTLFWRRRNNLKIVEYKSVKKLISLLAEDGGCPK